MANYSKQREAILLELQSRCDHPTAAQLYEGVRKKIPNISLGTVYRNLASLVESGDIIKLSIGDGFEHFDGNNNFHLHLHCKCCGNVIDVPATDSRLISLARQDGFMPDVSVCVINGTCKACNQ